MSKALGLSIMKIVVTGAHGMLGSALCKFFSDKGEVYAFHRDDRVFIRECHSVSIDLTEREQVGARIREINPDLLIHCAGLVDIDRCEECPSSAVQQNVLLTRNVISACGKATTAVYISSDQVYGDISPKSEEQKNLTPTNVYGATKLAGEGEALSHSCKSIVIRTNVIGFKLKTDQTSFADWVLDSLQNRNPISLFTDYVFSSRSSHNSSSFSSWTRQPLQTPFSSKVMFKG